MSRLTKIAAVVIVLPTAYGFSVALAATLAASRAFSDPMSDSPTSDVMGAGFALLGIMAVSFVVLAVAVGLLAAGFRIGWVGTVVLVVIAVARMLLSLLLPAAPPPGMDLMAGQGPWVIGCVLIDVGFLALVAVALVRRRSGAVAAA
ncbi:MAG: hypothetical protein QOE92_1221 [Chloroflexota bacterium]|jgi:hypothetical protein|nr:hypothetical protein [Chloroflexota bacterium]